MPYRLSPPENNFLADPPSLQVSLLIPAKNSAHALEKTVQQAERFLSREFPDQYEIIVIPNPSKGDASDQTLEVASRLERQFPTVKSVPHRELPGKGAALRTGLASARGKWIFFTDADLPYDLEFFARAAKKLQEGYGLISGNRRLAESAFDVPVELLPIAYGRHRLGLSFNRVVRAFFPIRTTDTQAGIKAMNRELARDAFSAIECPGFFFDLELFLASEACGYRHIELPVTLFLNSEKSTVRLLRDATLAAYWLTRIARKHWRGDYGTGTGRKPA
ncbi:MAG: glycosyltransferase [Oligoflexia bacterium]|nr:glycosyltransferase [Oligoflexia bacterium]